MEKRNRKRRGKGVVLASLALGTVSFLRKKENREKALELFNYTKSKMGSFMDTSKSNLPPEIAERITSEVAGEAGLDPTKRHADAMIAEGGAQTSLHYYNKEIQEKKK